jgi:transposase
MARPHCLRLSTRSTVRSSLSAKERHRHQEWLKFLRLIDQTIPQEKHIHLICDNYATHKHEKVIRWLDRHKRFHVYFTPTSAQLAQYGRTLLT